MNVLVINGPNINMLGIREVEVYGNKTYKDLIAFIQNVGRNLEMDVEIYQSNVEGFLVDKIQRSYFDGVDGIVINPAAYTHTSIAIRDALTAVSIPTVEVHLSDISAREDFRQVSYISDVVLETISGKGFEGYKEALELLSKLDN